MWEKVETFRENMTKSQKFWTKCHKKGGGGAFINGFV
tara:strand:- start:330 stop:440 length:111 start_codon:yes stop_codon:yes gene_type:complete